MRAGPSAARRRISLSLVAAGYARRAQESGTLRSGWRAPSHRSSAVESLGLLCVVLRSQLQFASLRLGRPLTTPETHRDRCAVLLGSSGLAILASQHEHFAPESGVGLGAVVRTASLDPSGDDLAMRSSIPERRTRWHGAIWRRTFPVAGPNTV